MAFFQSKILHKYIIIIIPIPIINGLFGAIIEKISPIIAPKTVPSILFFPASQEPDTELCIVISVAIPAKSGLLMFSILEIDNTKNMAMPVLIVLIPIFFTNIHLLMLFYKCIITTIHFKYKEARIP